MTIWNPMTAYIVIALIMVLVGYFLRRNVMNKGEIISQFLVILSCVIMLWIASALMPNSGWTISIVFMLLTLCSCVGLFMGWIKASFTTMSSMMPEMGAEGEMRMMSPSSEMRMMPPLPSEMRMMPPSVETGMMHPSEMVVH